MNAGNSLLALRPGRGTVPPLTRREKTSWRPLRASVRLPDGCGTGAWVHRCLPRVLENMGSTADGGTASRSVTRPRLTGCFPISLIQEPKVGKTPFHPLNHHTKKEYR